MIKRNIIQQIIRDLLPLVARIHPKNRIYENEKYPQLWNCWPLWTKKIGWIYWLRTRICGFVTGHELSDTEWGYGGGDYIDRHCRWCDKLIRIHKLEEIPPAEMKDLMEEFF